MSDAARSLSGSHINTNLRFAVVNGAAAGNVTVTGIGAKDQLLYVGSIANPDAAVAAVAAATLTTEFSVTAANTINNTGGTATTGRALLVVWNAAHPNA